MFSVFQMKVVRRSSDGAKRHPVVDGAKMSSASPGGGGREKKMRI